MEVTEEDSTKLNEPKDRSQSLTVGDQETQKTNWKLIILAGVISALNAVENSVIGIGEWPYMKTLDDQATAQFFGNATSASKIFHAIFAIIFSIWSFKSKSVKIPLAAGRFIAIFACMIYLSVENIPFEKRYTMATVYILLGISNSASTVLRAYITTFSTTTDRSKAFAIIGLSVIMSIVVGPLFQLIFSAISYPGLQILPGIRFHIYSAPIWFSFSLTIVTLFIIIFHLEDAKRTDDLEENNKFSVSSPFSIQKLKFIIEKLKKSKLDWRLIFVCLLVKTACTFSYAAMQTITSIFFMVQYGWTGEQTVQAGATIMIGFGIVCSVVFLLYIFCKLGQRLPQQNVFLVATIASGLVFIITYPYPPIKTTHSGCNPEEYSWCDSAYAVNPILYVILSVILAAPSIPLMNTALDTVYSNVLGTIDQSIGQGAIAVVDDIVYIITPAFTISIFTYFGVGSLWIVNAMVYILIAVIWATNLRKLRKLCDYNACGS